MLGISQRLDVSMSPLRIVLVDDHEMVLQGLSTILGRFLGRVRVVGQALDAGEALQLTAALKPDIVLCRKLVERDPAAKVVLLSAYDDEQYLFQAMRVGAKGYLLKQITGEDLVRHLERVADGETAIDAALAGRAVTSAARLQGGEFWPGVGLGLTQRESEVLALTVAGLSNRAIAGRLVVGEETIKTHLRSIYRKLEVGDRAGAVTVALREGIFH
jgi:DNA-binding NarL/FixJ family response regulator